MLPGQPWDGVIREELDRSDLVLLLVGPDFIASSYCRAVEVRRAVERAETGDAVLIPIIAERCDWQKEPFAAFQSLPLDGSALSESPDVEAALLGCREKLGLACVGHWYPRRPRTEDGQRWLWQLTVQTASAPASGWGSFVRRVRELGNMLEDDVTLAKSLVRQGGSLYQQGALQEAMVVLKQAERECRALGLSADLHVCLGHQENVECSLGNLSAAEALYSEKERICLKIEDKNGLASCLGYKANILYMRGGSIRALALYKDQEQMWREVNAQLSLADCMGNQARILHEQGLLEPAMDLYHKQEQIYRESGNRNELWICLGNQAIAAIATDNAELALKLHKEEEAICREIGNRKRLLRSLIGQSEILFGRGALDNLAVLLKEQEGLFREDENMKGLSHCLANRARIIAQQQPDDALQLAEEAYRLAVQEGVPGAREKSERILRAVSSRLRRTTISMRERGQMSETIELSRKRERINRLVGDRYAVEDSILMQAVALQTTAPDEALALHKEVERMCRESENFELLATCLGDQAVVVYLAGDLRTGLKLAKQAHELVESHNLEGLREQIGDCLVLCKDCPRRRRNPNEMGRLAEPRHCTRASGTRSMSEVGANENICLPEVACALN